MQPVLQQIIRMARNSSIILMEDDFAGTTIDTAKWTLTNPNALVSQNDSLRIDGNGATSAMADNVKSILNIAGGVAVVQANHTWTTDNVQEAYSGLVLFKDANNYARITSREASGGQYRLWIRVANVSVYDAESNIAKGKDVKIWTDGTDIKFYYWSGSAWTQMGTTQTRSLGYPLHAMCASGALATFTGADPAIFASLYFSNEEYATQYPT